MDATTPRRFSAKAVAGTRPPAGAERLRSALKRLVGVGLVWAFVVLVLQGQDGFFAVTVERVEASWLRFTVLNIPLHLVLNVVAAWGLPKGTPRRLVQVAYGAALLEAALIVGHVALSVATA